MPEEHSTTRHSKTKDLTGKTFGRLLVIKFAGYFPRKNGDRHAYWFCECACGTRKSYMAHCLISGMTKSCGCLLSDVTTMRNMIHGRTKTPEYTIWCLMRRRCYDHNSQDFQNYGGRGIDVCESWRSSFAAFFADMGKRPSSRHSLERLDNERGYSPENCIWATAIQQQRNKRSNRLITYNDETLCLAEWQERTGLPQGRIYDRLAHGWSIEKALFTPVNQSKRH